MASHREDCVAFRVYNEVSRCEMMRFKMFRRGPDIGGAFDASTVCTLDKTTVKTIFFAT